MKESFVNSLWLGAETLTVAVNVEQVERPGQWQSQSQS
jgi:hypothetical protein